MQRRGMRNHPHRGLYNLFCMFCLLSMLERGNGKGDAGAASRVLRPWLLSRL